jgi:hypothetical protein
MNQLNASQLLFKQIANVVRPVIRRQGSFSLMQFYLLTEMPITNVYELVERSGLGLASVRWSLNNLRRIGLIAIIKYGITNSPNVALRFNTYDLTDQGRDLFRHIFKANNQPTATDPCPTSKKQS